MAAQPPFTNPNIIFEDLDKVPSFAKAHGSLMGLAFVVFFPIGAVLIRLLKTPNAVWFHAACQLVVFTLMIGGLVCGIRMAKILDRLHNNGHTILGTAVVALMFLQPFLGYFHHRRYRSAQTTSVWTHIHVWYGRLLILVGIVNGGLGLRLASETPAYSKAGTIVYSVFAGISGVLVIVMVMLGFVRIVDKKKTQREG